MNPDNPHIMQNSTLIVTQLRQNWTRDIPLKTYATLIKTLRKTNSNCIKNTSILEKTVNPTNKNILQ